MNWTATLPKRITIGKYALDYWRGMTWKQWRIRFAGSRYIAPSVLLRVGPFELHDVTRRRKGRAA